MNKQKLQDAWLYGSIIAIVAISGLIGYMAKPDQDYRQGFSEAEQYCQQELLPAYEAGFMNQHIKDINRFAFNCTGDVRVYIWGTVDNGERGTLYRCDSNNKTFPVKLRDTSRWTG